MSAFDRQARHPERLLSGVATYRAARIRYFD